jgi:hypothetical protein
MTEKPTAISDACSSALKDLWHWIAAKLNRSLVSAFPVPNYKCRLRTFDARRNAIPLKRNRVDCCGIKGAYDMHKERVSSSQSCLPRSFIPLRRRLALSLILGAEL